MSRKIFRAITGEKFTVAVVQTASSGGGKWGQPVSLTAVKFANEDVEVLNAPRIKNNPKAETIESWQVNAANTGPRSRFGRTLNTMVNELPRHAHGNVVSDTGRVEMPMEDFVAEFGPMRAAALNAQLEANTAPALASWSPSPPQAQQAPAQSDIDRLSVLRQRPMRL